MRRGVVRLPSQPVDPRKLYNDYVWELLEIACRKGEISVSDIEGTGVENGEATRRFRYLQNNDLIARANSCGRSKKSFYTLTQRAMNIMESARKLESVASLS